LNDLRLSAGPILIGVLIAIVLNILYMYVMSSFTETLCMVAIVVYDLLLAAGIAAGAYMLTMTKLQPVGGFLIVFCGILALLFNCMLWCYWTHVKIGIAIVDATADFFVATKRMVLVSFGFAILGLIVQIILIAGSAQIWSMNKVSSDCAYKNS
jgi:hypothetical protein